MSLSTGHSRLSFFLDEPLAQVADALLLVGVRDAEALDVVGDLAHLLPVDAPDGEQGGLLGDDLDPRGDVVEDRPGIAQADLELALVDLGLVADADDLELLHVALGDADDGVVGQGPAEAVVGPRGLGVVGPAQDEAPALQGGRDARLERRRELAFLALEVDPVRMHRDGHARRYRDGFLPDSRHDTLSPRLPDAAEDFAARPELLAGPAGHDAAGRRDDDEAQAVQDLGDGIPGAVDPAARRADPLEAADDAPVVLGVLERHVEDALFLVVDDLVVLDVALVLEDLDDLDPQAEGGHVDFPLLGLHAVADPGEQVR